MPLATRKIRTTPGTDPNYQDWRSLSSQYWRPCPSKGELSSANATSGGFPVRGMSAHPCKAT